VRGAVYEVRPGDYGGGETDGRTVERGDENFWVCVEGVCYFDVVGDEGGEPGFTEVGAGRKGAGEGYICAAVWRVRVSWDGKSSREEGGGMKAWEGTYAEKKRPFPVRMVM